MLRKISFQFEKVFTAFFLFYLSAMLCLGRAFSVLHLKTPFVPVFITEIVLCAGILFILLNLKKVFALPGKFLFVFFVYLFLNVIYLIVALAQRKFFAFKDITLALYPLFLLAAYVVFSDRRVFHRLFHVLVIANIIGILLARILIFHVFPWLALKFSVVVNIRVTNYGLYFGIILSFLFALLPTVKSRISRFFIYLLMASNLYILFIVGERSIWLAVLAVFAFLFFVLRRQFIKPFLRLCLLCILVFTLLLHFDLRIMSREKIDNLLTKAYHFAPFIAFLLPLEAPVEKGISPEFTKTAGTVSTEMRKILNQQIKNDSKRAFNFDEADNEERYIAFRDVVSASAGVSRTVNFLGIRLHENECQGAMRGNLFFRFALWEQALTFGLQSPFFGQGFGVYPNIRVWSHEYMNPIAVKNSFMNTGLRPVHNDLLTVFYKTGLAGLLLFLAITMYNFFYGLKALIKTTDKRTRILLTGALGGLICWHVLALLFDIIDSPPTNIFLWVLGGLVFSLSNNRGRENSEKV